MNAVLSNFKVFILIEKYLYILTKEISFQENPSSSVKHHRLLVLIQSISKYPIKQWILEKEFYRNHISFSRPRMSNILNEPKGH